MKHLTLMFTLLLAAASASVLADHHMEKESMDDGMMEDKAMHDDDMMKDDDMMEKDDAMSSDTMMDDHDAMKDGGMMDDDMKKDTMNDH